MGIRNSFNRLEPYYRTSLFVIFGAYLALIQLSTSYQYIHWLPVPTPALLTFGVSALLAFYFLVMSNTQLSKTRANNLIKTFILLFFASVILSVFSALYTATVISSTEYITYLKGSMLTRILYYLAFLGLLYFGYKMFSSLRVQGILKLIRIYPLSVYLLVAVGIWQLLYFFMDIPFLDLKTRSYIHSLTGTSFFNFRLTSFADEPSYLGPILIDMVIIGYLTFKKKWMYVLFIVIPALFVLIFSFSVSGYFNLVIVLGFTMVYLLFHPKVSRKYLWMVIIVGCVVLLGAIVLKPGLFMKFFSPILGRMDTLFNPQSSSRIYMYIMPFYWLFDHSIISALFGYGPGSFEFLHFTKILPNKVSLATSSNNMYIDLLFETGIIGVLIILFALGKILMVLLKKGTKNIYYFIALIEYVHLLTTSMYRADFVTPRFWAVFLIIFLLIKVGEGKEERESEKQF